MIRSMSVGVALCVMLGCSGGPSETEVSSSEPVVELLSSDAFVGVWRCVTPSLEFIRLSIFSKSSQMGVLGAQLTYSGVAWEGSGRIEGDSLITGMTIIGVASSSGVMVAHARDARTLRVQMRPTTNATTDGATTDLTFVREH